MPCFVSEFDTQNRDDAKVLHLDLESELIETLFFLYFTTPLLTREFYLICSYIAFLRGFSILCSLHIIS
jgi:hypothetical protein